MGYFPDPETVFVPWLISLPLAVLIIVAGFVIEHKRGIDVFGRGPVGYAFIAAILIVAWPLEAFMLIGMLPVFPLGLVGEGLLIAGVFRLID